MTRQSIHSRMAIVLGPTGSFGAAAARALLAHGWQVRALHRRPETAERDPRLPPGMEWVAGDAMAAGDILRAARGAEVIIHALNPPRYRKWRELALPMLSHSIAAARQTGARLVLPGNIYNFGPDAGELLREGAPQNPVSRKGAVRVEMEGLLAEAAGQGVRSLVLRSGDYFGPHATSSWFGGAMVKPGRAVDSIIYPGAPDAGHAWAYLPDLAATLVRLLALEKDLPAFAVYHFGGHWLEPGLELAQAIRRWAGKPDLPIRRVPWALLRLAAPFSAFLRELLEMRYLWERSLRLDNRKLLARIGEEPHTPLDQAVAASLESLGCQRA